MRLIDADALDSKLDALAKRYAEQGRFEVAKDYSFVQTVLLTAPTIEVEPVKHGRWIDVREYCGDFMCSNCDALYGTNKFNYCPACGAKMGVE